MFVYMITMCIVHWGTWPLCAFTVILFALCVWRHRSNVVRLIKGTENKLGQKAKDWSALPARSRRCGYFSFQEVCGDEKLGRFICDNWSLFIIPTTDLIELVKDKFRTPDQKRFECQKYLTYLSIFVAIAIGVLSPFFTECISKKGEQENLERIETAIKEHKTVSIDSICVMPKDTFNVKVIQPKVMSVPNPTSLKQLPLKN